MQTPIFEGLRSILISFPRKTKKQKKNKNKKKHGKNRIRTERI